MCIEKNGEERWVSGFGKKPLDLTDARKGDIIRIDCVKNGEYLNYKGGNIEIEAKPTKYDDERSIPSGASGGGLDKQEYWTKRDADIRRMTALKGATEIFAGSKADADTVCVYSEKLLMWLDGKIKFVE